MIYYCDVDNTICTSYDSKYSESVPMTDRIATMNALFDQGHEVHYWTARGNSTGINWYEFTAEQLKNWNVKYTTFNINKPSYDVFIDDKAFNDKAFFNDSSNRS